MHSLIDFPFKCCIFQMIIAVFFVKVKRAFIFLLLFFIAACPFIFWCIHFVILRDITISIRWCWLLLLFFGLFAGIINHLRRLNISLLRYVMKLQYSFFIKWYHPWARYLFHLIHNPFNSISCPPSLLCNTFKSFLHLHSQV